MALDARTFQEILTVVLSIGGGAKDGSGIGILPSGKIVKIPPRQDLVAFTAAERDQMILGAVRALTQGLSNQRMKAHMESAASEAKEMASR